MDIEFKESKYLGLLWHTIKKTNTLEQTAAYLFPSVISFGEFLNLKMVLMLSNWICGFPAM